MNLYMFVVEYDSTQWVEDPNCTGELKYNGAKRRQQDFNVVAESQVLAEAEIANDKNFYKHQNPVILSREIVPIHQLVIVDRRRG